MGAALAQEPPPGVDHDSWRRVELAGVEGECLDFISNGHVIRLALADLRAMALDAGPVIGRSADARLQRIFEARTQDLLARANGWPKEGACLRAPAAEGEDRYVVAELLKAGRAALQAPASTRMRESIWVRYHGRQGRPLGGRGEILFYDDPAKEPFFTLTWWVS